MLLLVIGVFSFLAPFGVLDCFGWLMFFLSCD